MSKVYINGRIVAAKDAKISIFDRSYLYGEGAFETLRCYHGIPAFLDLHYRRLQKNCQELSIALPWNLAGFAKIIDRVLQANRSKNAAVRITVSPQGQDGSIMRPNNCRVNVVAYARRSNTRPAELYRRGADVISIESVVADSPALGNLKSTSYLTRMLARSEVQQAKADEGLIKNHRGHFLEGTSTNLFLVQRGKLITPPVADGALPGITRQVVLDCAADLGIASKRMSITPARIAAADEIFLTGSSTEVLPVHLVRKLWKHKAPGPITQQLMQQYQMQLPH